MEKRVILAIVLAFLVLVGFQYLVPPPSAPAKPPEAQTATAPTPGFSAGSMVPAAPPVALAAPATTAPVAAPLVSDKEARDIVVDTDAVHAVFSSRGAVLKSWRLKGYPDRSGDPQELVPVDIPDTFPRPFTVATDDAKTSAVLATALYQPSADGLTLGANSGALTFEYRDASGLEVRKTFLFQPKGQPSPNNPEPPRLPYVVRVDVSILVGGVMRPVIIEWGPAVGLGYSEESSRYAYAPAVVQFLDGAIARPSTNDLTKQPRYQGAVRFAGVGDQYFLSAVLPGSTVQLEYQPISLPGPRDKPAISRTFVSYSLRTPGAASVPFFIGPKDFDILHAIDLEFVRTINFGMFAWLVVPLLQALKWINRYVHNFGVSILVLTGLINLAIFPLRHKSMVSMKKMQAVQPQVKAIQERYKNLKVTDPDRQKMNAEVMALYKEKGVNPASGCVPMILTMPILFAFYAMLAAAIELRGAYFFGWIHDLSMHDPLYITPVLMGATMFWQQRMMPSTADPVQQKIFLIMPLAFTVGFLWAPAGLVVYWLGSNLMAIGQQYVTNRLIAAPPSGPRTGASAAIRRAARMIEGKK